jgi:hypothetical protein
MMARGSGRRKRVAVIVVITRMLITRIEMQR